MVGDRLAEGLPLPRVEDAGLQRGPAQSHGHGADADSPLLQRAHRLPVPVAGAADQVRLGDFTVLKDDLGGVAAAHAQLVFVLPHAQAGRLPLHDKRGDPVPRRLRIGHRHHDVDAADGTLRDEDFGPGDVPGIAAAHGAGLNRAGVTARPRFSQAPGAQRLSRRQLGEVALLLLFAGELDNVAAAERVVRGDGQRDAAVARGQGLDGQGDAHHVQAGSAVRGGHRHAPEAQFGQQRDELQREFPLAVPLPRVRPDLARGEVPHRLVDQALLIGEMEVHASLLLSAPVDPARSTL